MQDLDSNTIELGYQDMLHKVKAETPQQSLKVFFCFAFLVLLGGTYEALD